MPLGLAHGVATTSGVATLLWGLTRAVVWGPSAYPGSPPDCLATGHSLIELPAPLRTQFGLALLLAFVLGLFAPPLCELLLASRARLRRLARRLLLDPAPARSTHDVASGFARRPAVLDLEP